MDILEWRNRSSLTHLLLLYDTLKTSSCWLLTFISQPAHTPDATFPAAKLPGTFRRERGRGERPRKRDRERPRSANRPHWKRRKSAVFGAGCDLLFCALYYGISNRVGRQIPSSDGMTMRRPLLTVDWMAATCWSVSVEWLGRNQAHT